MTNSGEESWVPFILLIDYIAAIALNGGWAAFVAPFLLIWYITKKVKK
jgi:hypothetical protein